MAKYDVFISCKSEDYKYAEEIYSFLMEEGVNTFLASKELRKMGEAEYRKAISQALKEAHHIIIFASKAEYVESTWVEYEWDMFVNAKLKGKKEGNIVTILKEVDTDDLPMDLWKYESFPYDDYKTKILKYVETEASKERREENLRRREEEQRRLEEEREKEAKAIKLKYQLKATAEDYKKSLSSLQIDIDRIYGILHELNITERDCPICTQRIPLEETYCSTCHWQISPLDGIAELAYLTNDTKLARKAFKERYEQSLIDSKNSSLTQEQFDHLKEELDLSTKRITELENALSKFIEERSKWEKEICDSRIHLEYLKAENEDLKSRHIIKGDSQISEIETEVKEQNTTGDDDLIITIALNDITLKRVKGEKGDFFVTNEEIPSWLFKEFHINPKIGNKISSTRNLRPSQEDLSQGKGLSGPVPAFEKLLEALTNETGIEWDFPSIKEWTEAYNAKAFVKHNSGLKEWCRGRRNTFYWIVGPNNYGESFENYEYLLHAVIRIKDNPQLRGR